MACTCTLNAVCCSPSNQTLNVGDSWTEYAAWAWYADEFMVCLDKSNILLQIKNDGVNWISMSSTTNIKITAGANPQSKQGTSVVCVPTMGGTWTLVVNTGAGGQTWACRASVTCGGVTGYANFNITVNAVVAAYKPRLALLGVG